MVPEAFFVKTAVDLIKSLSRTLVDLRNERKDEINRIEKTFGNLNYLVPYYVVPNAQNVNPADFEEDDTGLIAKNNIFNLLDSFLSGPPRYNHAFVLSDAGMGKTSLLVMLELFYINKFIQKNFEVKLFKLAPETIDEISEIDSPHNTVLLLDALDEDQDAWENFYNRLQLILQATKSFRKVVITCRTQFFPIEHEEDGRIPGVVVLSGFHCSKIFLSPFTDEQVDEYLQKRFPDPESINKAKKIVSRMNSLKFRPMLLSYVDYFLDSKQEFNDALTVYKILVDEWLNRELRKGVISDKKEIFNACTKIAVYMYSKKKRAIEFGEVRDSYMTLKSFRSLEYMTIEGRSLLHRNSEGNYKFAHYSILEYFVAKHLISNPTPEQNTDQVIRFIEDMLIHHGEKKASGLNINNIQLQESRLKKINFSESSITGGIFRNSTLDRSDFSRVNSKNMNFDHCSLYYTNFSGAVIDSSIFRSSVPSLSNFDDSKFTQTEFDSSNFKGSTFNNTSLLRCKISDCSLVDSTLNQTDFTGSDLTDSIIKTDIIKKCTFTNAVLVTASMEGITFIDSNFSESNLKKCRFNDSIFKNTNFKEAELINAEFNNSHIQDSNLDLCNLRALKADKLHIDKSSFIESYFEKASLQKSTINNSIMNYTLLDSCMLDESFIKNTNLSNSNGANISLNKAYISDCVIELCSFNSISAIESKIKTARFDGSELRKSNWEFSVITNCGFTNCILFKSIFDGTTLENIDFNGSNLGESSFEEAVLKNIDFTNTILDDVVFSGANFENVNFNMARFNKNTKWPKDQKPDGFIMIGPGVTLRGQNFSNKDLSNIDFENAILTGSDFTGANLQKANFKGALLEKCIFTGSTLSSANLTDAKLDGAILTKTNLTGANMENTSVKDTTYNIETRFPKSFDPRENKMRVVVS